MSNLPGFFYIPEIIDSEYEKKLINFINEQEWKSLSASKNGRKVQQYGYEYDYTSRSASKKIDDIPIELLVLQKKALDHTEGHKCSLNQCIINRYEPGQGISAHVDREFFGPVVACFSLGSGISITFSKEDEKIEKYVEPRSLYVMTGESRLLWTHEIKPRLSDGKIKRGNRISVTFRSLDGK